MPNVESLLTEVRHVKAFLESAEAALSGQGSDTDKKNAARVGIEGAAEAISALLSKIRAA
ncbi:MAG: hypothetical protein K5872_08710 [Rhizobiaceae bacterium]|nr:hypothetical protein [Rhizobiaceae bacterium]MCV0406295.1 hypothetical protein [Rhizobiaceae bacterium]